MPKGSISLWTRRKSLIKYLSFFGIDPLEHCKHFQISICILCQGVTGTQRDKTAVQAS